MAAPVTDFLEYLPTGYRTAADKERFNALLALFTQLAGDHTYTGNITFSGTVAGATVSLTSGLTAKSGTAVPATAGAVAAGAPITMFSSGIKIWVTSDTPTHSATKGDLCLNTGGSSTSTRLFINNGTTAWIAITTAS